LRQRKADCRVAALRETAFDRLPKEPRYRAIEEALKFPD
jgi:hypothetical protein